MSLKYPPIDFDADAIDDITRNLTVCDTLTVNGDLIIGSDIPSNGQLLTRVSGAAAWENDTTLAQLATLQAQINAQNAAIAGFSAIQTQINNLQTELNDQNAELGGIYDQILQISLVAWAGLVTPPVGIVVNLTGLGLVGPGPFGPYRDAYDILVSNGWIFIGLIAGPVVNSFETTWQQTLSNNVLTIPLGGTYTVQVDWGDGSPVGAPVSSPTMPTRTYAAANTVRNVKVYITAGSPSFNIQTPTTPTRTMDLLTIEEWGEIILSGSGGWFKGASSFYAINATDLPDLSLTTGYYEAFMGCPLEVFENMASWVIPAGMDMTRCFAGSAFPNMFNFEASWFNAPSSVEEMFLDAVNMNAIFDVVTFPGAGCNVVGMFAGCLIFNQTPPVITSSPTSYHRFFYNCELYNQPLGWSAAATTNVTNFSRMFEGCLDFNRNLGSTFVTSNATNLSRMFYNTQDFDNGSSNSILSWNTSNVTDFSYMFSQISTSSFQRAILSSGAWSFFSATDTNSMFLGLVDQSFNNGGQNIVLNFGTTGRSINLSNMFVAQTSINAISITITFPVAASTINTDSMFMNCSYDGAELDLIDIRNLVNPSWGSFNDSFLTQEYMEDALVAWFAQPACPDNLTFTAEHLHVPLLNTPGGAAYTGLVLKGWTFLLMSSPMAMTWEQTIPNDTLVLPLGGTYSVLVDWDDGLGFASSYVSPVMPDKIYPTAAVTRLVKMIIISGAPTFSMQTPTARNMALLTVEQWGGISLSGAGQWFSQQSLFSEINAFDAPVLTGATSMVQIFHNCPLVTFHQTGMDLWNVPAGLSMQSAFSLTRLPNTVQFKSNWFNSPSSCFEMFGNIYDDNIYFNATFHSGIVIPFGCDISYMFMRLRIFNQTLPNLSTTAGRISYVAVLAYCSAYAQPLPASWIAPTTVQNIISYYFLFRDCSLFDQDLGSTFVTSNATNMNSMFAGATSFTNGGSNSIESWDTSNVSEFSNAFHSTIINYNLFGTGKWSLVNAVNLEGMCSYMPNFNNGGVNIERNFGSTNRGINMNSMFSYCPSLTNVAFGGTTTLPSGIATSITMMNTYGGCNNVGFTGSNMPVNFINNRVVNLGGTFDLASNFVGNTNMLSWDVSGVTSYSSNFIRGTFHATAFNQPVMEFAAWGGKMSLVTEARNMFSGISPPFTNGGQPIYWHPTEGTAISPLRAGRMFGAAVSTNAIDMTFGNTPVNSVNLDAGGFGLDLGFTSVNADFTGCDLGRIIPGHWRLIYSSTGAALTNFENSVIYWNSSPENRAAQGTLTTPFLWSALSGAAQVAITNLISNGWTITPNS